MISFAPKSKKSSIGRLIPDNPTERIYSYPVENADWRAWLRAWREVPGREAGTIDWYIEQMWPFLKRMPSAELLSQEERAGLRNLFKDYAIELLKVQKKADIRSYVEGAAIVAGVAATFWNPLTWWRPRSA